MTDLTEALRVADRAHALAMPQLHPRPQPALQAERKKVLAAKKNETKKPLSLAKQFAALQRFRMKPAGPGTAPAGPPPAATTPEQRKRDEEVRVEVQRDLCAALVRGVGSVAGRWCDERKAEAIKNSPAVQELLSRTTGWVHAAPDVGKLGIVICGKLLQ